MPLTLPDNDTAPYYIFGVDAKGVAGAALPAGASIAPPVSADPNTVILTPDATPQVAPNGVQSLASGTVSSPATVAQPNVAINITAQVTNADGSAGASLTDTVTIAPGTEATLGDLFGTATPVAVAAAARKR